MPANGKYQVVVVDPPWAYGSDTGRPNRTAESHYKTVGAGGREVNRRTGEGIDAIVASAPVASWLDDCSALFVWTTNPKLPFAFAAMEAWGAVYKTTLTWVKTAASGEPTRNGMGWFFRGATEHVLFGTRGAFAIPAALRESNVVMATRGKHSEKPGAFYDLVERVTPGARRLDVFARAARAGWDVWGDEAPSEPAPMLDFGGA